jgi:hypothetical protein
MRYAIALLTRRLTWGQAYRLCALLRNQKGRNPAVAVTRTLGTPFWVPVEGFLLSGRALRDEAVVLARRSESGGATVIENKAFRFRFLHRVDVDARLDRTEAASFSHAAASRHIGQPRSGSTRHDRCSHCSPQCHPSRTLLIGQRRSRSPCRPSPLLQCNRKPMARPSFPLSKC